MAPKTSGRGFALVAALLQALLQVLVPVCLNAEPEHLAPQPAALPPDGAHILDGSCVLEVGELRVNITNHGLIGSQYSAARTYSHAPSGEWPGGSGHEYLWGAGLWVGGRIGGNVSVSTGQFDREFRPAARVVDTMYESRGGVVQRPYPLDHATGIRLPDSGADDDRDGLIDEETLNGRDDDGDGSVDEDFGQYGDQMFSCTMYDNLPLIEELYPEHRPLGLRVLQRACAWSRGQIQNTVGLDYTITNVGNHAVQDVYLGFYVDCDIQPRMAGGTRPDDLAGFYSGIIRAEDNFFYRVEMGYMWDGNEDDPLPGWFGALLVDHDTAFDGITAPLAPKITAFEMFSTQAAVNQDGEPVADVDRYYLMSHGHKDITTRPEEAADYKFLISSGPFNPLEVGESLHYQVGLVVGTGFDGLLANAVEAARVGAGQYVDQDNNWATGNGGRETLVCLGDYPSLFGVDPILGRRYNFMDESCTGSAPVMFQPIIYEEDLYEYPDGRLCTWVNMDNCTECLRGTGRECDRALFFSSRPYYSTGTYGREAQYHWSLDRPAPPVAPRARVVPGDQMIEIFWDDRSEQDIDPDTGIADFESYRIWRVSDWVPPGDLTADSAPPSHAWGMIAEFDLINEIPAGVGGFPDPRQLGQNTGLEIARYEPTCLRDERFAGLAEAMQALVDTDRDGLWFSRPPIRRANGAVASGMEPFVKWESYPDVLDTFYAVTERKTSDANPVVPKRPVGYYHYLDTDLHNGFACYYAVVARDHALARYGDEFVPAGTGIEADPSGHAHLTMARPDGQTAADRATMGTNIYAFPNPATRESLNEFQPRSPSGNDPTGWRVMFNNLPRARNTIKIFTVAGDLVETIEHDGDTEGGIATWNLVSRNGQEVVSGVYLYSVHSDRDGFEPFRGKFVVIR